MPALTSVVIASAAPERLNSNASMSFYVARGFKSLLPQAYVTVERNELLELFVLSSRPDLVVVAGSVLPPEANFANLRNACDKTGTKLVFWLFDDPYEYDAHPKIIPFADAIFVNDSWSAWHYIARCPVVHLPLAACPSTHFRPVGVRHGPNVFFCGVGFENRQRLLKELLPILSGIRTEILGNDWDSSLFPFAQNARIANDVLPSYYSSAGLVLNVGRRLSLANENINLAPTTPGPRTFEAAMAGAAQVYFVEGLEIERYYDAKTEILLFDTPNDFKLIIERLLDEPALSETFGKAAQARTLAEHSYSHRAQVIVQTVGFDA